MRTGAGGSTARARRADNRFTSARLAGSDATLLLPRGADAPDAEPAAAGTSIALSAQAGRSGKLA